MPQVCKAKHKVLRIFCPQLVVVLHIGIYNAITYRLSRNNINIYVQHACFRIKCWKYTNIPLRQAGLFVVKGS